MTFFNYTENSYMELINAFLKAWILARILAYVVLRNGVNHSARGKPPT